MRNQILVTASTFMLLAGGAFALARVSRAAPPDDDADEQEVTLDQVPAAVRETILSRVDAASIEAIEIDRESGADVYDVETTAGVEFMVGPDGSYLGVEADDGDED